MNRPWLQAGPCLAAWAILNFIILPQLIHNPVPPDGYFLPGIHGDPEALEDARFIIGVIFWVGYYWLDPAPELMMAVLAILAMGWLLWTDSNSFGIRMFPRWELVAAVGLTPMVWAGLRRVRA